MFKKTSLTLIENKKSWDEKRKRKKTKLKMKTNEMKSN